LTVGELRTAGSALLGYGSGNYSRLNGLIHDLRWPGNVDHNVNATSVTKSRL